MGRTAVSKRGERMEGREGLLAELRRHNLRLTPQREAIYCYLRQATGHPRAEDVFAAVRSEHPSLSLATVYNTLNLLVSEGLARRLLSGESVSRFDGTVEEHDHVVCERCGRVADFYPPDTGSLRQAAAAATGFAVRSQTIVFQGLCQQCQQEAQSTNARATG